MRDALAWRREADRLGAFWALDPAALEAARRVPSPGAGLSGAAVAVKDVFDVRGMPTSAGLPGPVFAAREDAVAVGRLRAAGAVPVGKAAMDPLGWSTGGQAPGHPPCFNPVAPALSPGGSSSGPAVAVAAGLCPLGLGTDLSGSVRIPAAYCGIVGFKPASADVPREGCVATAPSYDAVGVLAASVDACLEAYEALAARPLPPAPPKLRIAVLEDLMEEADPGVAAACRARLEAGAAEGVELRAARLQARPRGFARLLAADLARTWGDRIRANPGEFPRSLREDLERVEAVPAERLEADRADLEEFRRRAAAALAGVEVAAAPTTPEAAPDRERQSAAVSVRFTRLFNALDWPAISLPCGRDGEGRPRALQLAAPPEHLGALCAAARHLGPPGPSGGLGGPETPQPTTRRAGLMADGGEVDVEVE